MIPIFRNQYDVNACMNEIRECIETGWTGQGFKTLQFEEAWKKYTGLSNAHMLCTGTAALNLAVQILKKQNQWDDDAEIISTPITFVATNNAILVNHLKVVFADVDKSLCLDPTDVRKKVTEKTRAIIFVGIGGNTGCYEEIVSICKEFNLKLILDAAHMTGTKLNGRCPGQEADAVVYSFHTTKNLSTADAGMLCFKDKENDVLARKLSWNGIDRTTSPKHYDKHYKWKLNINSVQDAYNGNSIMAAIALAQLPHVEEENAYRRQIAQWYTEAFRDIKEIEMIHVPANCISSRWIYQILVQDRDGLMEYLQQNEIGCALHYLDNTEYPMYEDQYGKCKYAHYVSDHAVSLPCYPSLTREEVNKVITVVLNYLETTRIEE